MTPSDVAAAARQLYALGLSVIPVPAPRAGCPPGQPGDGKVPSISWRRYQTQRAPADALAAWFDGETAMNVAIVSGAISDVVVVDADSPEALTWCTRRLPYTPWQTRTRRGFHLWYRHPGVTVRNAARLRTPHGRLAIDIRADGGYVIGPGSTHASGAAYRFGGDWDAPRAALPVFEPRWLAAPRPSVPDASVRPSTAPVVERARRYLAAIPPPVIGGGSDTAVLTAACRLVRGFALGEADAFALLWDWCGGRDGWTPEWVRRKVAHAERYGTEPIGGLR